MPEEKLGRISAALNRQYDKHFTTLFLIKGILHTSIVYVCVMSFLRWSINETFIDFEQDKDLIVVNAVKERQEIINLSSKEICRLARQTFVFTTHTSYTCLQKLLTYREKSLKQF